jgi:3-hydroxyisobutyrate dehydrogenase-like beta-hydroxyacid dehydrogenase
MSTIGPAWARRIGARLGERGMRFADAPVTGSSPKAEDGTLTIMVGGDARDFEDARPLFEAMGELVVHVGPLGQGQMVKLINNAVAAANAAVLAEALLLGRRAGVDLDALVRVMSAGAGGSAMLDLKARPMIEHDYATLFKLAHMLKDLRLCLQEAEAVGFRTAFVSEVARILEAAERQGHGDDDFAALVEPLERETGVRL